MNDLLNVSLGPLSDPTLKIGLNQFKLRGVATMLTYPLDVPAPANQLT
jgi:hypothetical protein